MTTKVCTKCGRELPLSEFNKDHRNKNGKRAKCKDCIRLYNYEKNKQKYCLINLSGVVYFKRCSICGIVHPISMFYKNSARKSGYLESCKKCTDYRINEYKRVNREKVLESQRLASKRAYELNNSFLISNLEDRYVKNQLAKHGIPYNKMTYNMILLKRSQLKLHRAIKSVCS